MKLKVIASQYCGYLLLILLFLSCHNEKKIENNVSKASSEHEFIESITQSPVSRFGPLRIQFKRAVGKAGDDASPLVSIVPKINAKITWLSSNIISIDPLESLGRGNTYKVELSKTILKSVASKDSDYSFKFTTKEQAMEFNVEGLIFQGSAKTQQMSGSMAFFDKEKNSKVESILNAKQDGRDLKIIWNHDLGGLEHKFTVLGVQRTNKLSRVLLNWDLKTVGINEKDKREILVKPYSGLEVVHAKSIFGTSKHVRIIFNDPLKSKQSLKGVIQVDKGEPNFKIDGSIIRIYFSGKVPPVFTVTINPGIEGRSGDKLKKTSVHKFSMPNTKPGVRFIGKGKILPNGKHITVPFEAVNVDSVQLRAFRIYKNNLSYFFQENNLKGSSRLKNFGRYLWQKTIKLKIKDEQVDNWSRFDFDIAELTKEYPNSLLRLELSINRGNSLYKCGNNENPAVHETSFENKENQENITEKSSWDYSESYVNQGSYNEDYYNKDDPCEDTYYVGKYYKSSNASSFLNVIKTNIGLMAKKGDDDKLLIVTSDIEKGLALDDVNIEILNFQNQLIASSKTNIDGFAEVNLDSTPFMIRASKGGDISYLKINPRNSLSSTHFDVGGEVAKNGLKGFIYGERGVWRPGDDIHLVLALHDPNNKVPNDFPLKMSLRDPKGDIYATHAPVSHVNGFYYFKFKTAENSATGEWKATAFVGPRKYSKSLQIEMVVPNRLKVNLDFSEIEDKPLEPGPREVELFSQWLHGADASGLRANVSVTYSKAATTFPKFLGYQFEDITRGYSKFENTLFDGKLNSEGKIKTNFDLPVANGAPGKLTATFKTKVFEEGGNFSTETMSYPLYPYKTYVGIKPPKGDVARGMLLTDIEHELKVVNVGINGESIGSKKVDITFHKITWKWWWDKKAESLANYETSSSTKLIESGTIDLKSGQGTWKFQVKYPDWGRYLLKACEQNGGHCSSRIVYVDWPGWAGRAQDVNGGSTSRLNITSDKKKYDVGETAVIFIPKTLKGRALVSIEGSSKLYQQFWVKLEGEDKKIEVKMTEAMAPNIYVNVSLIQPHSGKKTDAPLRLYGIASLLVNNPETKLEPILKTPEKLAPLKDFKISVSEASGRAMTYTVAMVDEGLLGLTRFSSPELQKIFYKKGSLGVMSWDLYDQVIGAYNAKLDSIISVGGDASVTVDKNKGKKRRFPPVVQFLAPQFLKAGETKELTLAMPNYIGAVRLMLIAGENEAYGKVSKSLQVKEDLMILPTLPRILGPEDTFEMPLTIFSMIDNMGDVAVSATATSNISFPSGEQSSVRFTKQGQKMVYIPLKIDDHPGNVSISVFAKNKKTVASKEVNLKIRLPNPMVVKAKTVELKSQQVIDLNYATHGVNSSNSAVLEVSKTKPLNIEKRLNYLIKYPHGCIEQTTSAAFPQLYLSSLLTLSDKQKKETSQNIKAAIKKLSSFQNSNGSLSYWPGDQVGNEWATNYAGHFLVTAKNYGHSVPADLLDGIIQFQKSKANKWNAKSKIGVVEQAYRLLFLALAKNADVGAMNLLRKVELSTTSKWQLAHALEVSGFKDQAKELTDGLGADVKAYHESAHTYGSRTRDLGIILLATSSLNPSLAKEVYAEISNQLSDNSKALNTQSIAFALIGATKYLEDINSKEILSFEYETNGKKEIKKVQGNMVMLKLSNLKLGKNSLQVKSLSKTPLYVTRTITGAPGIGKEKSFNNKLNMSITYAPYEKGNKAFEMKKIKRGDQFVARVRIKNNEPTKIENIALEYFLASGWDVMSANYNAQEEKHFDYQDKRDDRIFTYFSLEASESKTFEFLLQGTLAGRFYLPASKVEGMYNQDFSSQIKGQWVEVIK